LSHFEDESMLDSFNLESVEDGWNLSFELHINDCSNDLHNIRCTCEICPFLEETGLAAVQNAALSVLPRQDLSILADNMK